MSNAEMTGPHVARDLSRRFPDVDWIAALAKGAVASRADVEAMLASSARLPDRILLAAEEIERHIHPGDPAAADDVFAASTNADAAPIEVDAEAGAVVLPAPKPHPSRSGSRHEMGERRAEHETADGKTAEHRTEDHRHD
jgi:hypothetical protein